MVDCIAVFTLRDWGIERRRRRMTMMLTAGIITIVLS